MVPEGLTEKFAPLALLPVAVPPEADVNQLIVLPEEVALRLDEAPTQIVAAVAVTLVGAVGRATTGSNIDVLELLTHPKAKPSA